MISNLFLLLIMFLGLLILRRHGGGTSGLVRVLWKQVCFGYSHWRHSRASNLLMTCGFAFCKGVTWLALAIATGVPPLVSPVTFGPPRFTYLLSTS